MFPLFLSALLALAADSAVSSPPRTVLVELFTSQGCSSCPPAEKLLAELNQAGLPPDRVIRLAFHVDYWDGIGWKDPFSSSAFTTRQHLYARNMRLSTVYTPQVVVDGAYEMLGSDQSRVVNAIRYRLESPANFSVEVSVDTSPARNAKIIVRVIPAAGPAFRDPKWIYAATFLPEATTQVHAGENAGRSIRQVQIVRALADPVLFRPGKSSETAVFQLPLEAGESVAAWIQDYRTFSIDQATVWRGGGRRPPNS